MASRRSRVYAPALPQRVAPEAAPEFILEADASAHVVRVLRARQGEELVLFDGRGNEYLGIVEESDPRACRVRLTERLRQSASPRHRLRLLQAGIKAGLEGVLQQATELGVTDIVVFRAERSAPGAWMRRERAERVIAGAAEQCGRLFLPALNWRESLAEALSPATVGARLIAVPGAPRLDAATEADVDIVIGPEGGFSVAELALAEREGFVAFGLGALTLRAATAAPVAIAAVQQLRGWQDLGI